MPKLGGSICRVRRVLETHRPRSCGASRRLDTPYGTQSLRARLDRLLRSGSPVRRVRQFRRLDSPPHSDVLLETVATSPHQGAAPRASGRESGHGDQTRGQSQKLLAVVSDTRHANRDAQPVARATRTAFAQTTLVRPRSASRNRLVRTRMLGGVGRAVSNDRPYPISAILCLGLLSLTVRLSADHRGAVDG